jgi:4-hydroxy-3-methylbut-2-enyl diphosphate reductase
MQVILSKYAGACYGVERALSLVEKTVAEEQTVSTLGQLIHNPQVVQRLASQGVSAVQRVEDASGGSLVLRSHGVGPGVIEAAKALGLKVVDATCPHVTRAQQAARDLSARGCTVVVVGERHHPEVEALCAWAGEGVLVIQAAEELDAMSASQFPGRVGVVVQTTQSHHVLEAVVAGMREMGLDPLVCNTICSATRLRQEAARELADEADVMLVVGGRNSSNTTRLYEISAAACAATHHIELPEEIEPSWFHGAQTVGVTAGASTPKAQIEEVIARLSTIA